jgi:predicted site-specific integrase-resolvase
MRIGCARVSTNQQNLDLQRQAFEAANASGISPEALW